MKRGWHRIAACIGSAATLSAAAADFVVGPGGATAEPTLEYQVKAGYLYNFIQFIDWPRDVFNGDFKLCVLGVDRFGSALDSLQGERAVGRTLRVLRFDQPTAAAAAHCHVLFVSRSVERAQVSQLLGGKGVLTVGEAPDFTAHGGVINLVERQGHIRFQVNQQAAQRAGLAVSSRLLQLALDNR